MRRRPRVVFAYYGVERWRGDVVRCGCGHQCMWMRISCVLPFARRVPLTLNQCFWPDCLALFHAYCLFEGVRVVADACNIGWEYQGGSICLLNLNSEDMIFFVGPWVVCEWCDSMFDRIIWHFLLCGLFEGVCCAVALTSSAYHQWKKSS